MPDFSGVSYDEAMRRARQIVPTLRERAQKCVDARVLLPENEKLLHETGLFRYHQPKRFGGMELPFVAVVDIVAELFNFDVAGSAYGTVAMGGNFAHPTL